MIERLGAQCAQCQSGAGGAGDQPDQLVRHTGKPPAHRLCRHRWVDSRVLLYPVGSVQTRTTLLPEKPSIVGKSEAVTTLTA